MQNRVLALLLTGLALAALAASAGAQPPAYDILLVDDDWDYRLSHPGSLGGLPYYTSALEALGLGYEAWDVQTQGQPADSDLLDRDVVIWFTGYAFDGFEADPGVFTPLNEARVATYLDAGGRFILSSQEYYYYCCEVSDIPTPFMQDYLGVQAMSDVYVYTTTVGVAGNAVGDGIGPLTLVRPDDYGTYWPAIPFEGPYDDEVYARPEAETPFRYDTIPFPPNSTNFEGQAFKTAFLGWPFEWVDTVNQRAQVLGSILSWMGLSWPVPEAPVLAPIDNSDGDGAYQVDWSDSTGTIAYTLEEDDNSSFSSPAVRYHGPESKLDVTMQPLGTRYYRARASNPTGDSGWSNVEQVTVTIVPPDTPALAPIDNADGDGDYWVMWGEVPTGITYTLEEDDHTAFTSPVERYAGPDTQLHIEGQTAGLWFYRVRAAGAGGESPWSNIESAGVLPEAPQLAPIGNADGDGQYLVDWSDVVGALFYSLQEDDNPGFSTPVTRYSGPISQFSARDQPGGSWYYRVRANNAAGAGPWSNVEVVYVIPAAPYLKPVDNPDGDGEYVVAWEEAAGAITYTLQEDDDPSFEAPTVRYAGPGSELKVEGQPEGEWFYRVKAGNSGGDSPWSDTGAVKVAEAQKLIFLPFVVNY